MKRAAVIGFGALGHILVEHWSEYLGSSYELTGVLETFSEHAEEELEQYGYRYYRTIGELLSDKPDYVIELAGIGAVKEYGAEIVKQGIHLIVTSVGALAEDHFREELERLTMQHNCRVLVTSGAVGGFDVLQTIALMGNAKGRIDNFKAPASLNGAPYLNGCVLPETEEKVVFDGNAREAILGFPKNVNVAISSGLASVGLDDMQVTINSIPGLVDNVHRIHVENDSVRATIEIASKPDPVNPKSSVMTAWSVIALLRNLDAQIQFF